MAIAISSCVVELIHRAADDAAPHEACGLLFGAFDRIDSASIARNVAADPARHFEIDPVALFAAMRAERAGGPAIVGHWHSHPSGQCAPSATDAAMAIDDGRLWLIAANDAMSAWRARSGGLVHGRFDPVDLDIG